MASARPRTRSVRLPADYATSIAILANMLGGRSKALAVVKGTEWPGSGVSGRVPSMSGVRAARIASSLASETVRIGDYLYTASTLMQMLSQSRAGDKVDAAMSRFHLNRNKPAHILSAYAYVWARYYAPGILRFFWKLPMAGDNKGLNERFALALGRYERDNPGTVFLAENGNAAAQQAIEMVLDRVVAGHLVNPPIEVFHRKSEVNEALDADSATARAILGIQTNRSWVAHHILPFASVASLHSSVQEAIVASKWVMDSAENLIALPANNISYFGPPNNTLLPMHRGSHPRYNIAVSMALNVLNATDGPATIRSRLSAIEARFRRELILNRAVWHERLN